MVVGQQVALGRIHTHQIVTVLVSETILTVKFDDGDVRVIRHTTAQPVRSIRASGRRPLPPFPRSHVAHQLSDMRRGSVVRSHPGLGIRRGLLFPI